MPFKFGSRGGSVPTPAANGVVLVGQSDGSMAWQPGGMLAYQEKFMGATQTTSATTSATGIVGPVCSFTTTQAGLLLIWAEAILSPSAAGSANCTVRLNGTQTTITLQGSTIATPKKLRTNPSSTGGVDVTANFLLGGMLHVPVAAGVQLVEMFGTASVGTITASISDMRLATGFIEFPS